MSSRYISPFFDVGSGIKPSSGSKLFFFEPDGVTPKDTFSDQLTTPTPNTNPVIADSNGVFGDIFISGEYKNTLKDKNDVQIFGGVVINEIIDSTFLDKLNPATLAIAIADTTLAVGDILNVQERSTGSGGSAFWKVVLKSTVTISPGAPANGNIVASTGDLTLALVLRTNSILITAQWGAISGSDNSAVYQAMSDFVSALLTATTIRFSDGTSILGTNTTFLSFPDGLEIDFGQHEFDVQTPTAFSFGDASNNIGGATANNNDLHVHGGKFDQVPNTTDRRYISITDTAKFEVDHIVIENVGNGGILIGVTTSDFDIHHIESNSVSDNSVRRAIWINGAGVVGFVSEVMDLTTFAVTATSPSTIFRGEVRHCTLLEQSYGIYMINTRDTQVHHNYVKMGDTVANRCIAVNNFCPRASIHHNKMESNVSASGVIVTQGSVNVTIESNKFFGSFGGNRDIYVQDASEAVILDNQFETDSSQKIEIDNGGFATVKGNTFRRRSGFNTATKCAAYKSIDVVDLTQGSAAVSVGGLIFKGNTVYDDGIVVDVEQNQSIPSLNYIGAEIIEVADNTCFNRDQFVQASGQAILNIVINDDSKPMNYSMYNHDPLPYGLTLNQSRAKVTGTDTNSRRKVDFVHAMFEIDIVSAVVTVTKLYGDIVTLSAGLNGNDLSLTPRTGLAQAGAGVARITSVTASSDNVAEIKYLLSSTSTPDLRLFDIAGAQIGLATTDAKIKVVVSDLRAD